MIFFFSGLPRRLLKYHTSFTTVSLASEPELQKKARLMPGGAIASSRSARSMAGSLEVDRKAWA